MRRIALDDFAEFQKKLMASAMQSVRASKWFVHDWDVPLKFSV